MSGKKPKENVSAKPTREAEREVKLTELMPGDVLLFSPGKTLVPINYLTEGLQALSSNVGGHYDTLHAAMCVGKDRDGHPIIAHVTEEKDVKGASQLKYVKQRLDEMQKADGSPRAFQVFRSKFPLVGETAAAIAGDEQRFKNTHWSLTAGAKVFLTPSRRPPISKENAQLFEAKIKKCLDEKLDKNHFGLVQSKKDGFPKTMPDNVVCSTFIAKILKITSEALAVSISAEQDISVDKAYDAIRGNVMNLRSSSSPKMLEAYFSTNPNYQHLVYTACKQDLYNDLINEIKEKMDKKFADSPQKALSVNVKLQATQSLIGNQSDEYGLSSLQKASLLLSEMKSVLKEASLYDDVFNFARKHGMSHLHVEKISSQIKEIKEIEEQPVVIHRNNPGR